MSLQEWAGVNNYEPRATLAVVFTDIIDSTTLARSVGDAKMFDMLVKHFEAARNACRFLDGFEIKLIGDAYMVVFHTADGALQFALAFRSNTGDERIAIRVGIHVGQVRIKDDDIYGLQVNLAERLSHVEVRGEEGIFISTSAKRDIDSEHGTEQKEFRIVPLPGVRLKGFAGAAEQVFQVVTPEIVRARIARTKVKREEEARKNPKPPQVKLPDPPRPTLSLGIRPRRLVPAEPETPTDRPQRLYNVLPRLKP